MITLLLSKEVKEVLETYTVYLWVRQIASVTDIEPCSLVKKLKKCWKPYSLPMSETDSFCDWYWTLLLSKEVKEVLETYKFTYEWDR